MKLTDEEILVQFKDPESKEKAFRNLLSNYQERLYYHVRRYVHNHEDANDILQNTCIKIWNAIDNFRGESGLYTWLYRIAGNEAITFINKNKKRNEQPRSICSGNGQTSRYCSNRESNYPNLEIGIRQTRRN